MSAVGWGSKADLEIEIEEHEETERVLLESRRYVHEQLGTAYIGPNATHALLPLAAYHACLEETS